MIRNALGSLLGLVGATAAVWSPFRAWYDGRHGSDYRIEELFSGAGITPDGAAVLGSLLLPFLFTALLTLGAVLLRSRLLMALAGLVTLGTTILWMVRQGQAAGSLSVGNSDGLGPGVAGAFAGGVLLLLAAVVMSGRRGRRREPVPEPVPYSQPYAERTAEGGPAYDETQWGTPQPGAGHAQPYAYPYDPGPGDGPERTPDGEPAPPAPPAGTGHGPVLGSPLAESEPGGPDPRHGPALGPPLDRGSS
ncbi:hypothetical protein [Streptomyces sp. NPDC097619]|uniref:hypothetical protein n=1 Tax=Streptomyces sp. NPDC097619 TaxID=3157228 RepID=UPI00331F0499